MPSSGQNPPPLRPLDRTLGGSTEPGGERAPAHPAIHGRRSDSDRRLFPRETDRRSGGREDAERREAMRRHPAGKARSADESTYEVKQGDTLWGLAAQLLGDDDPVAIARLWPRLHRLNRDTIGPDPRLLYPGQKLRLPSVR